MVNTAHETPTQDTHDFYIGRMVNGTQDIVQELQYSCPDSAIIAFDGLLVLPLMPRRAMRNKPEPLEILVQALCNIQPLEPRVEQIQITGVEQRYKSIGNTYSLRLPFLKLTPRSGLQEEASCLRLSTDPPHTRGMPLVFRALESKLDSEVATAARTVQPHLFEGNNGKVLDLTVPKICAVPKKRANR